MGLRGNWRRGAYPISHGSDVSLILDSQELGCIIERSWNDEDLPLLVGAYTLKACLR
jgi:hypothetical protein